MILILRRVGRCTDHGEPARRNAVPTNSSASAMTPWGSQSQSSQSQDADGFGGPPKGKGDPFGGPPKGKGDDFGGPPRHVSGHVHSSLSQDAVGPGRCSWQSVDAWDRTAGGSSRA